MPFGEDLSRKKIFIQAEKILDAATLLGENQVVQCVHAVT